MCKAKVSERRERKVRESDKITINIRHNQHLRLRKTLLQVIEVDGVVKRHEPDVCTRISGQSETEKHIQASSYLRGGCE